MTVDNPRLRLGIIGIVTVSLFAALFARLWFLQVLNAGEYELAAERNQRRVIPIPAPRGRILDRNGAILVGNRASNVVTLNRSELNRRGEAERRDLVHRLAAVVGRPAQELVDRLDDQRLGPFTPVPVAVDVPEEALIELRERRHDFPGVEAQQVAVRDYPHGPLAAHLLGYVGPINAEELETAGDTYRRDSRIGKDGVERAFEADLRGSDGEVVLEVNAEGVVVRELARRPPVQGNDLVLSLDLEAQRAAEEALSEGLEKARRRRFVDTGAPLVADAGSVVALDILEGTVTAMASWPAFAPGDFVYGITPQQFAELNDPARATPFVNRALQGQYAPGSTWKLVTAMAALQTGLISTSTEIDDKGVYTIPNCSRACVRRNAGSTPYGPVAVSRALTVSSDVFFYSLGANFWQERGRFGNTPIQDTAEALGFGQKTGIDLPVEADGRIATPERRAELHAQNPEAFPTGEWFVGDTVNLAIGQGELAVTPIQLANAYATFANGGTRYVPNVALRVQDQDGTVVREIAHRVAEDIPLPPDVRAAVMEGLVGVTAAEDGTAYAAFKGFPLDQYRVAGKTGTAQATPKQDTALFAAVAPADGPRHAVSVVMEQAGFGGNAAAPVARAVLGTLSGLEPSESVKATSEARE